MITFDKLYNISDKYSKIISMTLITEVVAIFYGYIIIT